MESNDALLEEPVKAECHGLRALDVSPLTSWDVDASVCKIKGSSLVVKVGTKVKNIRLTDGDHDIDCKIDGIGAMGLKSEFVKKV